MVCLVFFSPVIVSAAYLFEPFIGQLLGYWLGIDLMPGVATWLGTFIATIGVAVISKADRMRGEGKAKGGGSSSRDNSFSKCDESFDRAS